MIHPLTTKENPEIPENVLVFFSQSNGVNMLGFIAIVGNAIYSNQVVIEDKVTGIDDPIIKKDSLPIIIRVAKETLAKVEKKVN